MKVVRHILAALLFAGAAYLLAGVGFFIWFFSDFFLGSPGAMRPAAHTSAWYMAYFVAAALLAWLGISLWLGRPLGSRLLERRSR